MSVDSLFQILEFRKDSVQEYNMGRGADGYQVGDEPPDV
jgi:hypothetical protein